MYLARVAMEIKRWKERKRKRERGRFYARTDVSPRGDTRQLRKGRGREREREREKEKKSESINGDNRMERAADRETGTYLPTRPGWVQDLGIII